MRILICGSDGYLGFPLCENLLVRGHQVFGIDSFFRRMNVEKQGFESIIPIATPFDRSEALKKLGDYQFDFFDITYYEGLAEVFRKFNPDAIVNLAQLPSAPFSMINPKNAAWNVSNNVNGFLNLLWCMREYNPESSIVTLGTMGEYGCPNMNIPEGFFEVEYEGRKDFLPFPRQGGSIYHCSKIMTSDLALLLGKTWNLKITDIMQGVVFGSRTRTMNNPVLRTRFDIDECFGTMINRAVACAVVGHPIIPYGLGEQKRGYLQLQDSIDCITLWTENLPTEKDSVKGYRIVNQLEETYTCNELANLVKEVGESQFNLDITIENIPNPRVELEKHYYNPHHEKLLNMGWKPQKTMKEGLTEMFEDLLNPKCVETLNKYKDKINPTILWRKKEA